MKQLVEFRINNAEDIDLNKIKIMKDYGVAYEHNI